MLLCVLGLDRFADYGSDQVGCVCWGSTGLQTMGRTR